MAIIGAILGDIAGSRFEFDHRYTEKRQKGEYTLFSNEESSNRIEATDDTFMSIACMQACETDMDFAKAYREIGLSHFSSYGTRFIGWLQDPSAGPYNSLGNGSAMRCSYCADKFFEKGNYDKAIEAARASAAVTHNHPEGIKGAEVTVKIICMIRDGYKKEDIEKYAIKEYPKNPNGFESKQQFENKRSENYNFGVDRPLKDYHDDYYFDETCPGSVPVAIRCFLDTNSFTECCKLINSMRCDTDTLCAIAGPLCEEYYGNCLGSKEADEEMVRKYVPQDLIEKLEKYGVI